MRKIFTFIATLLLLTTLQAQNTSFTDKFTSGVDIFNDLVMDAPDGIDFRAINPGANVYGMYTYPIPKSNISLAIGLGLGMHNLHSNGALGDSAGISSFTKIPASIDYKINKLQLTYLDIPAEIRFKTESGFRVALGFKAGYLISAHTKYKGDDPEDGARTIKIKESKLINLEKWRYGPTFQIGYKFVSFTGFYSLSTVFDEVTGPSLYPVSIGISLRPF